MGESIPSMGSPKKVWRDRIAARIAAELEAKPAYAQFRIIGVDDGHREIVRVERLGPNGRFGSFPMRSCRKRGDRTISRKRSSCPRANIRLAARSQRGVYGVIERPHRPTLRVATPPLHARRQTVRHLRRQRRHAAGLRPRPVIGAAGRSDIRRQRTRRLSRSPRSCPRIRLAAGHADQLAERLPLSGIVARSKASVRGCRTGSSRTIGRDRSSLPAVLAGNEWVGVIETVPNAVIMAPAAAIRNTSLLVGLIAVLCAAALAVFIARSLTRPISQLTAAVEGLGNSDAVAIPVDAGGETGVLARAFARVMERSQRQDRRARTRGREHRRTEAARDHYAARERLFSAAVESSNDAIITKSLDGTITGWNPAAERLFGYTAAEAVGKGIDLIVPAERKAEIADILRRIGWGETIEQTKPCGCARMAVRWRFRSASLRSRPVGGDHRRIQDRPRHHRKQENPAGAQPADRGAAPHLRNLPGSDPGHRSQGHSGSGEPKLRSHTGISAGGDDRSQRDRFHPRRRPRQYPRGNARRAARTAHAELRFALRPQGRADRDAVVDGDMVGAGQAAFLRRPRHDRKPAGAGNIARKRATGARHHRYRAGCLRPDGRKRNRLGLEFAGGKDLRMVARRSAWGKPRRIDHSGEPPRRPQVRPGTLSCAPEKAQSSDAVSKSRPGDATERKSRSN